MKLGPDQTRDVVSFTYIHCSDSARYTSRNKLTSGYKCI